MYQDHLKKFVQLRLLKSKLALEIANQLLEKFSIFGVPSFGVANPKFKNLFEKFLIN